MKIAVFILGFLFLVSCTSNTILEKPKNLIPKDKMADILTDLFLATGAKSVKNSDGKRQLNYMSLVFEKHQIDSTRYKESNYYYTSLIDANSEILTVVEKRLNKLKDSLHTIEQSMDSISRKTAIDKKGSLRQLKRAPLLKSKSFKKPNQLIKPRFMHEDE